MLSWVQVWEWLQTNADDSFGWSFLGFWVGLIIGGAGIYLALFYQRKPHLVIEILSRTPVLSIKERVENLKIFYDYVDILESEQELYILTLRISNPGGANIGKGNYDENAPISLKLIDAEDSNEARKIKIIQNPGILNTSDNYFDHNLSINLLDDRTFIIEPIIIDSKEFFVLKLVALVDAQTNLSLKVEGKVEGVKKIRLLDEEYQSDLMYKDIPEKIARYLALSFLVLLPPLGLLFILAVPIYFIGSFLYKRMSIKPIFSHSDE